MTPLTDRYHRQILLPQVGPDRQARLAAASVLLVGVGALGTTLADMLVRAGVGRITLIDRDVVEATNLQRQTLFAEADVGAPKAAAAAGRLRAINGGVEVRAEIADLDPDNAEAVLARSQATLLLDGTDNAATRYLLNDVSVKHAVPWIYGACVGVEGRAMPVLPGDGPCLRCVFPTMPTAGELATCDTAGVLGPAAGLVAQAQAAAALRLLAGERPAMKLLTIDAWQWRFREIDVSAARRPDCPACGERRFEFRHAAAVPATSLCGRNTVQVRTHARPGFSLDRAEAALRPRFAPRRTEYLLRCRAGAGPDAHALRRWPGARPRHRRPGSCKGHGRTIPWVAQMSSPSLPLSSSPCRRLAASPGWTCWSCSP